MAAATPDYSVFNYAMYTNAVQKALDKIGNSNGHQFRDTWVSTDPRSLSNSQHDLFIKTCLAVHEYNVSSLGASYFERRRKDARKIIDRVIDENDLTKAYASVKPGGAGVILQTPIGMLTLKVKSPASRLDTTVLKNALRARGVDVAVIEACFEMATLSNKPAESLEVVAPLV